MIEFGAIKVENGIVIEKIDLLIKTNNPLPKHITSLTNITDEMLSKGVNLKDALTQIVAFVKGCVLIAHNGINFDLPFLNKVLLKNNFKIIDNTLIDTMQLSRAVNVKMKRHNLGVICREYKITYDDDIAHRADYDASVLFGV
jgi:DNA polymerase-3 subunit alpha (Gram-positive type)